MTKYIVRWSSVCYWSQEVEADTPEQAIRLLHGVVEAEEQAMQDVVQGDSPDLDDEYDNGEITAEATK